MLSDAALQAALDSALEETQTLYGSSRFACYRRCQQSHHLRYSLRIAPNTKKRYFGTGSVVHAALRFCNEGVMAQEAAPRDWRVLVDAASRRPDFSPEACDEASHLLQWYFAHWGEENAGWPEGVKVLGCEVAFEDATSFALPYTARADALLEHAGQVIIVDTKTRRAGLPEDRAAYARKLATRPQFLGLSFLVQKHLGLEEPPLVWVNALCKLKMPKFGRVLAPITQGAINQWCDTQKQLADAGLSGIIRNYDACAPDIGAECEYFQWCHGSDEERALHYTKEEESE